MWCPIAHFMSYFVIHVVLYSQIHATTRTNSIDLVSDFLSLQRIPSAVSAFLCWRKDEYITLIRNLSDLNFMVNQIGMIHTNGSTNRQVFLLDANCDGYAKTLNEANRRRLFRHPFRWLILMDVRAELPELDLYVDSRFYVAEKLENSTYRVRSIHKLAKSAPDYVSNDIGIWRVGFGFVYFNFLSASNRSNLMGIDLNVSYVITHVESLDHLWDYRYPHIDGISKLSYILSHYVMDFLNATGNFIIRETWGYRNETTGIYSGMIGDLRRDVAELGATPAFITKDRVSVIEFVPEYVIPTYTTFIFRAPPLSYVKNVFVLPFDAMVWYACFVLSIIIALVIYVIVVWEWNEQKFRTKLEKVNPGLRPRFFDVVLMELGAVCQQGAEAEPKSGAGRIATLFVFVTLMFLYTSYSANIVALLQSTSDSIDSLEDLLHSRIKLGVENVPYGYYYFKTMNDSVRRAIYEQKVAPKGQPSNFMGVEEGVRRMRNEFFAFHSEPTSTYKVVGDVFQENEKCALREIQFLAVPPPMVVVKKNSSFKEMIKIGYRRLHETGIQSREYRRIYTRKPVCRTQSGIFMSVGLIDCYYAFVIFAVGVLCSLTLLLLECAMKKNVLFKAMSFERKIRAN